MAGIQERTAAELKAELTAAIAQSRALLSQSTGSATVNDESLDRLTGMELSFDDHLNSAVEYVDYTSLTDEELEILLRETEPAPAESGAATADLRAQIAENPLLWAVGALVAGSIGARLLLGEDREPKNPRQNASQRGDSAITHGSLMGQIMKTGFEAIKPTLFEAAQGWLIRFVEKKP